MSVTPLDEGLPRFCDFRCAHGRCRVAPGIADIGQHGGDFVVFQQPAEFGHRRPGRRLEHPFGTIKARMGATHFLMKTLPKVATEMALHVLAYNLTRVMNIMGVQPLMAAMRA